jgi:hypothetical protein
MAAEGDQSEEEENADEAEELAGIEEREFGKTDRDNIESKRQRLRVLGSPVMVPKTVEQLSAAITEVSSSAGRTVLEAARDVFVKVTHLPAAQLFLDLSRNPTRIDPESRPLGRCRMRERHLHPARPRHRGRAFWPS